MKRDRLKEAREWVNCLRPPGTDDQTLNLTQQAYIFLRMGFNTGELTIFRDSEGQCEVLPYCCLHPGRR